MILYHGSNVEVREPRLLSALHTLDFGPGFYTTSNFEQAADFAKKVVDRNDGAGSPTVTTFRFVFAAERSLSLLKFVKSEVVP